MGGKITLFTLFYLLYYFIFDLSTYRIHGCCSIHLIASRCSDWWPFIEEQTEGKFSYRRSSASQLSKSDSLDWWFRLGSLLVHTLSEGTYNTFITLFIYLF